MKKVVLFALLLAATAAAASAQILPQPIEPRWGSAYQCDYQGYTGNATDLGISIWHTPVYYNPGGTLLIRAKETFSTSYGSDTYNVTWAKPNPQGWGYPTIWEFTFNPDGPQCKRTLVYPGAYTIVFSQCTDGHSRRCELL